jgi:hypothetical protein
MSHAGWDEIGKQALALLGAEPIQLRILAGLGIAFVALMIVEGLRVSFITGHHLPSRRTNEEEIPPREKSFEKAVGAGARSFTEPSGPFRPRATGRVHHPKTTKNRVSRHRAVRPTIRRTSGEFAAPAAPTFTDEAAPFSSLPAIFSHSRTD